ncbi:sugar phosphate isomerase/epimerase family protein [Wenxinia marina]|uniref:Sugar phosphate isomerase/epimerase n=1 Tax=Wenxinia marina DSM 24838 TaxID=1123501 RepID=A0A0D0QII4_9RHOB|nr:sugar phosphate isomerase/epimerase [Wenxinia marina]KIQ70878.1 Sugar phosphate isomerase/epimerase [Wenxinia marina DSM 24838]GGL56572.1 xylose isomerase [Wenxinia marina]
MTIAYQLYCSRNWPLADTMKMLGDAGYEAVEGYGGVFEDTGATKALMEENGLSMPSGHFALDLVESDPGKALGIAKALGVTKIYVPFVMPDARPTDRAGWEAFAKRLAEAGKPVRDAGLGYGWHNHDFELADLGGVTPLELIADAGTDLELDLGWVLRAGKDPAEWLNKFAGKVTAAHVKDIAPAGEATDEDGWADVGHGVQDWGAIRAALDAQGVDHLVIEHDKPNDHARFARRSIETVKGW